MTARVHSNRQKRRARGAFTLLEVLVAISILALSCAFLLAAVQRARHAARRIECANKLKQMALALHSYAENHGRLPYGCCPADSPQPHMSWMTQILPFLEQDELWRRALTAFAAHRFFEAKPHLDLLGRPMPAFWCPIDDRGATPWDYTNFRVAFTSYQGVEGVNVHLRDGVLFLGSRVSMTEITDGTSTTLLVGERPPSVDHNFGWWYAGWGQAKTGSADSVLGVREVRIHPSYVYCETGPYQFQYPVMPDDRCDFLHFWSFHPGGANFAFCDGSARFLAYSADPVMPALATRAGGEAVSVPD